MVTLLIIPSITESFYIFLYDDHKNAYEIDKKIVCDHKNAYEIEEYEKMILKISFYIAHCDADGYKK